MAFEIKQNRIKVGGITSGEDVFIKTIQYTDLKEENLIVKYAAWSKSDYDENGTEAATRIPLTNVPDEIKVPFNKETDKVTIEKGNQELMKWMKENLDLKETDFTIIEDVKG